MNHPDFRVGGKIFATLGPDEVWGGTLVQLAGAEEGSVWQALKTAWRNTAPKRLAEQFDED